MKRTRTGQEVRMADIPADAGAGMGAFENIHDFAGGAAFSSHLAREAQQCHGAPGRAFLEWACTHADTLARRVRSATAALSRQWVPQGASGQVERVGARFALVGVAGELATEAGLTGWPVGESERAARACFDAWLAARGGAGNGEVAAMLRQVRRFLESHGEGRFTWWHRAADDHNAKTLQRAGFRRMVDQDGKPIKSNSDHQQEYGERMAPADGENTSVEYFVLPEVYGAYPYAYNGTYTITVTGATTFTYTMASNPGGSASIIGHLIGPGAAVMDFTGARDDRWTGGVLGGVLVMNNGIDGPQYWAGSDKLRTLHGWSSTWTAKILAPFKDYLLAFDVTKNGTRYPHMMKWSAAAIPGAIPHSWDSTDVTLDAGEVDIAETSDLMVDALPLGDALIVYKERSMYAVRYVGYPAIFAVQRLPGDSGMLFRGCGAMTPLGHVVLTAGDVVLNTGSGVQSIADGIIRKYIFRNIDSTNYKRAFVATNPQRNEVLVCFPVNRGDYLAQCEAYLNLDSSRAAGKDCKQPSSGCRGVWLRAQERHKKCMEAQ
ncbi:MAG: hypothetical protein HYY98_15515 [Burkholderiales bacterium]|nr:hypothetical protein [Burkholderiales bacterium]